MFLIFFHVPNGCLHGFEALGIFGKMGSKGIVKELSGEGYKVEM